MTCPHYRGTDSDERGRPTIRCMAAPRGRVTFLSQLVQEETVENCCLAKYPGCMYYKKYEEVEDE